MKEEKRIKKKRNLRRFLGSYQSKSPSHSNKEARQEARKIKISFFIEVNNDLQIIVLIYRYEYYFISMSIDLQEQGLFDRQLCYFIGMSVWLKNRRKSNFKNK